VYSLPEPGDTTLNWSVCVAVECSELLTLLSILLFFLKGLRALLINKRIINISSYTLHGWSRLMDNYSWSHYRPGLAQRVGKGIALLFHDLGTRRGWVVSSTPRPYFTPGKDPVLILQEAGLAPGPVWTAGKSRPHRDSIPDVQPVVSRYTDWATRPSAVDR